MAGAKFFRKRAFMMKVKGRKAKVRVAAQLVKRPRRK